MATNEQFNEFSALLKATNTEDPKRADLDRIGDMIAAHPDLVNVVGDMAAQVRVQVIANALGDQFGVALCTEEHYYQLRDKYGYKEATPIERSLIDHLIICWMRLQFIELNYDRNIRGVSVAMAEYWEKKLSAHQKRYLRAVESLMKVRRLLKEPKSPAFNLLLAQQINNR